MQPPLRKTLLAAGRGALISAPAAAETIGATMALFDDNPLTALRNGIIELADGTEDADLQVEDAHNDVAKQLDLTNGFIVSGVDAIIVNPVET